MIFIVVVSPGEVLRWVFFWLFSWAANVVDGVEFLEFWLTWIFLERTKFT